VRVSIKGHDQIIARLRRLPKQFLDATAVGEFNAAQEIMTLAKSRAPYEFGALEKAAFVQPANYTTNAAMVEMGFHGVPYIEAQHEVLDYSHPGKESRTNNRARAARGQPKFLESAINDLAKRAQQVISASVAYFLKTGKLPRPQGRIGPKR
jgi:hypothetical protein